jgi:hypothetical protein
MPTQAGQQVSADFGRVLLGHPATMEESRPLKYGAGVVVQQPPAAGDVDLMVDDLLELATVMGC